MRTFAPAPSVLAFTVASLLSAPAAFAGDANVGAPAPLFTLKNQDGKDVSLADRKGKGWTVVFFYPKAGTPGCTKQACAFRDSISVLRKDGAEVYGISADTVAEQAKFHAAHNLGFPLLADADAKVIASYGVKMEGADMAKRWTFIIDPSLTIRHVNDKVDPALDAKTVADTLVRLKVEKKVPKNPKG